MMEETTSPDLFDVKLNASGKYYIRKFARIVRIVIILGIIVTLIQIITTVLTSVKFNWASYENDNLILLERRLWPLYLAVYTVFFCLQLYYYWQLSRQLTEADDYTNEDQFNRSFYYLFRYAFMGMIIFSLAICMYLFDLYVLIKYW